MITKVSFGPGRGTTVARVAALSPRLRAIVDALPLRPGLRVIEIGCGTGGAFDGRHPRAGALALVRLGRCLVPGGRLLIDGGTPLREVTVAPEG